MSPRLKIASLVVPNSADKSIRLAAEAFRLVPNPLVIIDADLHILECNNHFLQTFDLNSCHAESTGLARYFAVSDLAQIAELIDTAQVEQEVCLTQAGMRVRLSFLSPAGPYLLSFTLVSETEQKLNETRSRLQMVVEGVSVGLVVLEAASYQIVDINTKALQLFGRSREEMTNKTCHQFFCQDCGDNCFESSAGGLLYNGKRMLRAADGSLRPVAFIVKRSKFLGRDYLLVSMSDISSQHSAELEVSHLANFDLITELPNRTLLLDRLGQSLAWAERAQSSVAFLLLDIDNFKDFNDSLGHASGDQLLALLGERIKRSVRRSDTVARFGGDEFALVLTDIGSQQQVASVANKILTALGEPCSIDGRLYRMTASIGIAFYPSDAKDSGELVRLADTAMYRAKEAGRNQFQFFSPEMNADVLQRLLLTCDLHQALEQQQFEIYYQPQIDMRTGSICGTEALLRWHHPTLGMISPDQFIQITEETGLIIPLGLWVLETACQQVKQWQESLHLPLRLAVNLSAIQFRQTDLVAQIGKVLQRTNFNPAMLELELTETMLMAQVEKAQSIMEELKRMGVTLAIDDFGTGYSSLSYLKHFPIDRLKIDRSFVKEITENEADAAIVEAMIAMAGRLGHEVIAEGVEQESQAAFLLKNGCHEIQGFLFGQPVPAAVFMEQLQTQVIAASKSE